MSTGVVAQVLPMHLLDVDAYELLGLDRGRNYGNSDINKAYRRASLVPVVTQLRGTHGNLLKFHAW